MSFSKIFQILSIVGSTFLIFIPECLNNSWWCFSSSFLDFEDEEDFLSQSCSVLVMIHGSSLLAPSHNYFDCENSFHPSGAFQEYFSLFSTKPIILEDLFILSFQLLFPKSNWCIIQYSLINA